MKIHLLFFSAIFFFCIITNALAQTTRYVKQGGTGDGSTWNMASGDLQAMINASVKGDQVWVAGGNYYPIRRADVLDVLSPNDRHNAFVLKNDVKMYGGFAGTNETMVSQRDSTRRTNNTILNGDIGTVGDDADNAYHVVISVDNVGKAELNGFSIINGNANGDWYVIEVSPVEIYDGGGGGVYNESGALVLTNVTISQNKSNDYGGGIYNLYDYIILTNAIISGNKTDGAGGGLYNTNTYKTTILTNVSITGNMALNGAGIYNEFSSPFLTNVTISGNLATDYAGGIDNFFESSPKIRNCIIYGNSSGISVIEASYPVLTYSLVQGRNSESNGNIRGDTDPLFKNQLAPGLSTGGNYHLKAESPVINKGNNNYFNPGSIPNLSSINFDVEGNDRFIGIIDLGAYEFDASVLSVNIVNFTALSEGNRTKLNWSTATESNNKEFTISHSTDGRNFTAIGNIAGAGNTNTGKDYVFYDENPVNGINFYRLLQVDYDGTKTNVGVRSVNFSFAGNSVIKVFPNPVKDALRIEFAAGLYHFAELTDVNGKVLQHMQLSSIETEKKIDLSSMPSGIYFIKLAGNDNIESRKIVKQ